ncbi:MAG: TIGR01212 family radical SAM protein [Vampirovibrionales bacterium]|nr:TIGR01212 family radical SAM protein [Vampirovibrionales bacterium]
MNSVLTIPSTESLAETCSKSSQPLLPFRSYNSFLRDIFGERVAKITLDAGFNCPNRDGSKGVGGCTFCDETGSSSRAQDRKSSLTEQMRVNIARQQRRFGAQKFMAYFQSFTNTYAPVERLKLLYDEALNAHPDVVGLAISTRPDCVDEEKLALLAQYASRYFLQLEYGVQTCHDRTLALLNRCETHADFINALTFTRKVAFEANVTIHDCAHVILGLPEESWDDMMTTANTLAQLNVAGVKIHLLVAMRHTPIAKAFEQGQWQPMSREAYIQTVVDFIERLHPDCVIHRIGGNGHPQHVVAPRWLPEQRHNVLNYVTAEFQKRGTYQGCRFPEKSS